MKVIVPVYRGERWIERALASLEIQDHPDFDVLVIDDASEDMTAAIVRPICERRGWRLQVNDRNMRAGFNLYRGIHSMEPEPDEPVFILDGDDFLPHGSVLSTIERAYEDPDAWFVYGTYEPHPYDTGQVQSRPYPEEMLADAGNGRLRYEENLANHPITFRYFLFCGLTEWDMTDDAHVWFRAGYDRLMFIPMLEMASRGHVRFIDGPVLYSYNAVNPLSDTLVNLHDAQRAHRAVAERHPKEPLTEPLPHRIGTAAHAH